MIFYFLLHFSSCQKVKKILVCTFITLELRLAFGNTLCLGMKFYFPIFGFFFLLFFQKDPFCLSGAFFDRQWRICLRVFLYAWIVFQELLQLLEVNYDLSSYLVFVIQFLSRFLLYWKKKYIRVLYSFIGWSVLFDIYSNYLLFTNCIYSVIFFGVIGMLLVMEQEENGSFPFWL